MSSTAPCSRRESIETQVAAVRRSDRRQFLTRHRLTHQDLHIRPSLYLLHRLRSRHPRTLPRQRLAFGRIARLRRNLRIYHPCLRLLPLFHSLRAKAFAVCATIRIRQAAAATSVAPRTMIAAKIFIPRALDERTSERFLNAPCTTTRCKISAFDFVRSRGVD